MTVPSTVATVAAGALAGVVLAHGAWWTLLSAVALPRPGRRISDSSGLRLAVIVPAHNEEAMLGDCLGSLLAAPYEPRPEVVVVADNCDDRTAEIARELGVTVIERTDATRRGKSFALDAALAALRERERPPDAVLFVDADTEVSTSFFAASAGAIAAGAAAVQVHYEAARGDEPVARLRRLAFLLAHWSRPLGMARLGLGSGLKGNGMALRWELVRDGFGGTGITEDAAMTLDLARRGVAVVFEPRAWVRGHMAASYAAAGVQDRRWEGGRFALMGESWRTAARAASQGRFAAAAAATDVGSLPLSLLAADGVVCLGLAAAGVGPAWLLLAAPASLATYVALGLAAARASVADVLALAHAPRFVAYKLGVLARVAARRGPAKWERTSRV